MTRILYTILICFLFLPTGFALAEESIVLTGDIQMRLGDAFMAEGEYYRAVTEYKKYLILFPEGRQSDRALFKTGMAYYLGLEYDSAIQNFALVHTRFPDSPLATQAAYHEGICSARLNRLDKAVAAFDKTIATGTADDLASRARLGRALVMFEQGDLIGTRTDLNRFIDEFPADSRSVKVRSALSLLPQDNELPRKSPLLAGILSAIVPGSGHMYAGHYGDGITALLLNGLFIAGTTVAIQQENYAVAGVVGVIGLPFYIGNIYGAANAATKWNLGVRKGLREKLEVTLDYRF